MSKVSARWVRRLLTDDDMLRLLSASQECVKRYRKEGKHFLNSIITTDNNWLWNFDPETKAQPTICKTVAITTGEEGARLSVWKETCSYVYGQSRQASSTPSTRRKNSQRRLLQRGNYNFLKCVTKFAFIKSKQLHYLFLIYTIREDNTHNIAYCKKNYLY